MGKKRVTYCAVYQSRGRDSSYNGVGEHDDCEDCGWESLYSRNPYRYIDLETEIEISQKASRC